MADRGHQLQTIFVADDAPAWERAGFTAVNGAVSIGPLRIQTGAAVSTPGWGFDTAIGEVDLDGISILNADPSMPSGREHRADEAPHPNGAVGVDHVVVVSPDLDRSTSALEAAGFTHRKTRDVPGTDRQQRFFWAGDIIIEMVGPAVPEGEGPASIWGLALVVDDISESARRMGDLVSTPRPAVQRGRSICAIKTRDLGLSVTVALMTPHADL